MDLLEDRLAHRLRVKGEASYCPAQSATPWAARHRLEAYRGAPRHDLRRSTGPRLYTEKLDLTVDGEPQRRPRTPWSESGRFGTTRTTWAPPTRVSTSVASGAAPCHARSSSAVVAAGRRRA